MRGLKGTIGCRARELWRGGLSDELLRVRNRFTLLATVFVVLVLGFALATVHAVMVRRVVNLDNDAMNQLAFQSARLPEGAARLSAEPAFARTRHAEALLRMHPARRDPPSGTPVTP